MAKYRVLEKSFINGTIAEVGAIVEYEGEISGNLEPLTDRSRKSKRGEDEQTAPETPAE